MGLEENSMNLVGEIFNNPKLPVDKIKSFSINWDYIDGYYFPNVQFTFYETLKEKENADTKSM
jgi:hypothetical protein